MQLLRILDSETLWTLDMKTIVFLLNSVDPQRLTFSEQQIIDTLNALYDNNRNEQIDFDEFLYQLAFHDKVTLSALLYRLFSQALGSENYSLQTKTTVSRSIFRVDFSVFLKCS